MPAHAAQFYGDDRELAASVRSFLAEGLPADGAGVVVATAAHRRMFGRLADGVMIVDADETLRGFLTGDVIDEPRFRAAAKDLIWHAAGAGPPLPVYGEMVALLWDAGQVAQAIELEALWNDLIAGFPISLMCGYPARLLAPEYKDKRAVRRVCRLHTSVIGRPPGSAGAAAVREFPRELQSARAARQFVLGVLASQADEATQADAAILVSELAANAVLHADSPFTVTVSPLPAGFRIAVRDTTPLSAGAPLMVHAGHGLDVVAQLAARWAVEPLPDGKVIWADLG